MPLGPDFKDPPAAENLPPYFVGSTPLFLKLVDAPEEFSFTVADRNPNDQLYVRWVSDYPEFQTAHSRLLEEKEITTGFVVKYTVPLNCVNFAPGMNPHRLMVIVSDRPFKKPENADNPDYPYASTVDPTMPVTNGWFVQCQ